MSVNLTQVKLNASKHEKSCNNQDKEASSNSVRNNRIKILVGSIIFATACFYLISLQGKNEGFRFEDSRIVTGPLSIPFLKFPQSFPGDEPLVSNEPSGFFKGAWNLIFNRAS